MSTNNDKPDAEQLQVLDMAVDINERAKLQEFSKTTTTTATTATTTTTTSEEQMVVLDIAADIHETDKLAKFEQQHEHATTASEEADLNNPNTTPTGTSGGNIQNAGIRDIVAGNDGEQDPAAVPLPLPGLRRDVVRRQQVAQPGAYSGATLERNTTLDYDLLAVTSNDENGAPPVLVTHSNSAPTTYGRVPDSQLAVANPVTENQEGPTDLMHANPVDLEAAAQRDLDRKEDQKRAVWGLMWVVLLAAVIFGFVIAKSKDKEDDVVMIETDAPTIFGSMTPSDVPSSAPSAPLEALLEILPNYTLESLNKGSDTPQWKAWNWLRNHENITFLPVWRKEQLFGLATFYYSMNGDNWRGFIRDRWMDYEVDECEWFSNRMGFFRADGGFSHWSRVQPHCNDVGHYKHLELRELDMYGVNNISIPPEISLLTSLSALVVTGSEIKAVLSEFLPTELFQTSTIRKIDLGGNHLHGTIPTEFSQMSALRVLSITANQLVGTVPAALGFMTGLTNLAFRINSITGTIPSELALLTNLYRLSLENNELTGSLPSQLWSMTNLQLLSLGNSVPWGNRVPKRGKNMLTGQISTEIGRLSKLIALELDGCQFTGSLPSELGLASSLSWMRANNNFLTGQVPSEIAMTLKTTFDLDGNLFTGTLPISELQSNTVLRSLALGSNSFSGTIATELGTLTSLIQIDLSNLPLVTGTIPSEIGLLSEMNWLLLDGCSLSGPIPSEIGLLTGLREFRIFGSSLSGTIPTEVGLMTSLTSLSLQNNNLTGELPSELNLTSGLRLEGNQFSGRVPRHLCSFLWCDCSTNATPASSCYDLTAATLDYPGRFPPTDAQEGQDNTIMFNVHIAWARINDGIAKKWSWYQETNVTNEWTTLQGESHIIERDVLHSFALSVARSSTYKLLYQEQPDFDRVELITRGWITLTSSNRTVLYSNRHEVKFTEVDISIAVGADGSLRVHPTILCDHPLC